MNRRGAGIAAIKNKNLAQSRYKDKGSEIASEQLSQLSKQMEIFRANLEEFAIKHKHEIKRNPQFRSQFQRMCAAIGVDPLASSKGFWSKMLGVGDFYYELAVQIVEVCLATSHRNGGILPLDALRERVVASRGRSKQEISNDDILAAIGKLKMLGNGFSVIPVKTGSTTRYIVQSIPGELTMDHTMLLQLAETSGGFVSSSMLQQRLNWEETRTQRALDYMIKEGLAWVDKQSSKDDLYWFPGLFNQA